MTYSDSQNYPFQPSPYSWKAHSKSQSSSWRFDLIFFNSFIQQLICFYNVVCSSMIGSKFVVGGRGCKLKAYLHVQGGERGSKVTKSERTYFMDDPLMKTHFEIIWIPFIATVWLIFKKNEWNLSSFLIQIAECSYIIICNMTVGIANFSQLVRDEFSIKCAGAKTNRIKSDCYSNCMRFYLIVCRWFPFYNIPKDGVGRGLEVSKIQLSVRFAEL